MRTKFDKEYYDHFYRNPSTQVASRQDATTQADFIHAYLRQRKEKLSTIKSDLSNACVGDKKKQKCNVHDDTWLTKLFGDHHNQVKVIDTLRNFD